MTPMVITIDGPAGSGKTTVSRRLAGKLNLMYVDTGALYRAVALAAKIRGIDDDDMAALETLARTVAVSYRYEQGRAVILLDGEDVTGRIRTPDISIWASRLSALPVVRRFLLGIQQDLARQQPAVFEGRDMGTVVFPDAEFKFYLDGDPAVRARRRYEEFSQTHSQSLTDVARDIATRDQHDSTRSISPLKPAKDAIVIDTTALTIDEVVSVMASHIRSKTGTSL